MQTDRPTYADLGVIPYESVEDPAAFWRALFYDGKRAEPIIYLFAEEPEHRAIEELMERTETVTVAVEPPMAEPPADVEEAADRLLAVARGMKSINDSDGIAALLSAAAIYQSLYRADVGAYDYDAILTNEDGSKVVVDHKTGADR